MSDWSGFKNLDLSGVEDGAPSLRLESGEHDVKCTAAEIMDGSKPGAKSLRLDFLSVEGAGEIRAFLNIVNASEQAQQIARRQLKTFLTSSGHPDPDKPGDISSLVGLECRIRVGLGKPYTKDGEQKQYQEVKSYMPSKGGASKSTEAAEKLDDEIPF